MIKKKISHENMRRRPDLLWNQMCRKQDLSNNKCRRPDFLTNAGSRTTFRTTFHTFNRGISFRRLLDLQIYFVPNPNNLVSQVLLCARRFHTLNRGISFRRLQILLISFWKRDRKNVFYKCSNSGQMFLRRKIFSDEIRNEVKSGNQAIFEMKSLD